MLFLAEAAAAIPGGHDPITLTIISAALGGAAYVGRSLIARQEKLVEGQEKMIDKIVEKIDKNHREQLADMRDTHVAQIKQMREDNERQIDLLQSSSAAQVEILTGISIGNQNAITAFTVQIDRYTREMQDLTRAINDCPGVTLQKLQRTHPKAVQHEQHEH